MLIFRREGEKRMGRRGRERGAMRRNPKGWMAPDGDGDGDGGGCHGGGIPPECLYLIIQYSIN